MDNGGASGQERESDDKHGKERRIPKKPEPVAPPDDNTLPGRLRIIRDEEHITQEQMAKIVDRSLASYSAYESGQTDPLHELAMLERIYDEFGTDWVWLTGGPKAVERVERDWGVTPRYRQKAA